MNLRNVFSLLFIVIAVALTVPDMSGQQLYSYVNENGVQVFSNMPSVKSIGSADSLDTQECASENSDVSGNIANYSTSAYDSIINKYANYYQLDPYLIHSIIAAESGFNPKAVSSKGALGLMQLMPATAKKLGVKDSFDPEQNISAGVRHFRSLMDMFGNDLDLSLAAYNAGENLVMRLGRIPSFKETIDYVESVTNRYREKLSNALNHMNGYDSPTFRYMDGAGVLHLTNIPPVN